MEAVAREFFDSEVTMEVVNQSEEDERTGKKEHVVFLVKQFNQVHKTVAVVLPEKGSAGLLSSGSDGLFLFSYSLPLFNYIIH